MVYVLVAYVLTAVSASRLVAAACVGVRVAPTSSRLSAAPMASVTVTAASYSWRRAGIDVMCKYFMTDPVVSV